MRQRALTLLAVLGVALAATGLLFAGAANASSHSATRSISPASVAPGGQVEVTISAANLGGIGQVIETLPDGFTYVSTTHGGGTKVIPQGVRFTVLGVGDTFTYTVEVDSATAAGDYSFSGVVRDADYQNSQDEQAVGGDTDVTVTAVAETPTEEPTAEPTEEPTVEPGTPTATRSLPSSAVTAGSSLDVTITLADYGGLGRVVETLPAGFTYDSTDLTGNFNVTTNGQDVSFSLIGDFQSFTYSVTASSNAGAYDFSGVLTDADSTRYDVGGDSGVTVEAVAGPRASRSFSPSSVTPGGSLNVRISVADYGGLGRVVETLPAGFTYVSTNLSSNSSVRTDGRDVIFSLIGDVRSFTYTVTAPETEGSYSFTGNLLDEDTVEYPVGGASAITVAVAPPTAIRSFSESTVAQGESFDVTILALNYGGLGRIVETLPVGFTFESAQTAGNIRVVASGRNVTFSLIGANQVRYTVTAAESAGRHVFSGILIDVDSTLILVGGANTVTVKSARPPITPPGQYVGPDTPTPEPTATAVPPTATAVPPTATAVPPTATAVPPTATSVPPTATSVPPTATSVPPTATSVPPTATSVPPTATSVPPTATSVPPTATSVPPTATSVPPTATAVPCAPTATSVPPTATAVPPAPTATTPPAPTATSVPPTATSVPPTATSVPPAPTATSVPPTVVPAPTPAPTATVVPPPAEEEGGGFPAWAIILIILAVIVVAAGAVVYARQRMMAQQQQA